MIICPQFADANVRFLRTFSPQFADANVRFLRTFAFRRRPLFADANVRFLRTFSLQFADANDRFLQTFAFRRRPLFADVRRRQHRPISRRGRRTTGSAWASSFLHQEQPGRHENLVGSLNCGLVQAKRTCRVTNAHNARGRIALIIASKPPQKFFRRRQERVFRDHHGNWKKLLTFQPAHVRSPLFAMASHLDRPGQPAAHHRNNTSRFHNTRRPRRTGAGVRPDAARLSQSVLPTPQSEAADLASRSSGATGSAAAGGAAAGGGAKGGPGSGMAADLFLPLQV